jgi:hypothetical protein
MTIPQRIELEGERLSRARKKRNEVLARIERLKALRRRTYAQERDLESDSLLEGEAYGAMRKHALELERMHRLQERYSNQVLRRFLDEPLGVWGRKRHLASTGIGQEIEMQMGRGRARRAWLEENMRKWLVKVR